MAIDLAVMTDKISRTAVGIAAPRCVAGMGLDAATSTLAIRIDFVADGRPAVPGMERTHPVRDMRRGLLVGAEIDSPIGDTCPPGARHRHGGSPSSCARS